MEKCPKCGFIDVAVVKTREKRRIGQLKAIERAKALGIIAGPNRRVDRDKVKELYQGGNSMTKIAKELGCSVPLVSQILNEGKK